jgi:predicted TIM-barrel fold metal-dependent hydrolase
MANRFDYRGGEHEAWLAQVQEPVLAPDLPIVDAHHHLWIRGDAPYLLREFAADLATGHRVVATVFAECHSMYRVGGPDALRPVGEMEFVAGVAAMSDSGAFGTSGVCRAAVGNADLALGAAVEPVLDALAAASGGRFRGVRASVCWDASAALHRAAPRPGYLAERAVRDGIAVLERRGLSLDCWLYHPQIDELAVVADTFPDLTVVLNHCGTPILGGPYRDHQEEVRAQWLASMRELARRPSVFVKLGALPARFGGSGARTLPPGSAEVAAAWRPWIEPCIEAFGARRCLFESNFPVHKNWLSYPILWNAFKRIAAGASAAEQADLFAGTAVRVYRMTGVESAVVAEAGTQ